MTGKDTTPTDRKAMELEKDPIVRKEVSAVYLINREATYNPGRWSPSEEKKVNAALNTLADELEKHGIKGAPRTRPKLMDDQGEKGTPQVEAQIFHDLSPDRIPYEPLSLGEAYSIAKQLEKLPDVRKAVADIEMIKETASLIQPLSDSEEQRLAKESDKANLTLAEELEAHGVPGADTTRWEEFEPRPPRLREKNADLVDSIIFADIKREGVTTPLETPHAPQTPTVPKTNTKSPAGR